jgi:hypothetical protein
VRPFRLPQVEAAVVAENKISGYLLDLRHPHGQAKARFFAARGFSAEQWAVMAAALRQHPIRNLVVSERATAFAVLYAVDCRCSTPDATDPCIRTVWEIRPGDPRPRLITAYPHPLK